MINNVKWNELNDRDFIEFLQVLKKTPSICKDIYKDEYPCMIERITDMISKNNISNSYLNGYEAKSLACSYNYINSIYRLTMLNGLIDNKGNLTQEEKDDIVKHINTKKEYNISIYNCIGLRLTLVIKHIGNIENLVPIEEYNDACTKLNNFISSYNESKPKGSYFKELYKSNTFDIKTITDSFDILLDYYTKSICDNSFNKIYEQYTMDDIINIDRTIKAYNYYFKQIKDFLNDNKEVDNTDFDIDKFLTKYNGYVHKEFFFAYLYIHYGISNKVLKDYLYYYKKLYLDTYGTNYNELLNKLFKLNRICKEYNEYVENTTKPCLVDKNLINAFTKSDKNLDKTFISLYNDSKLYSNVNYTENEFNKEDNTKYCIISDFINRRTNMLTNSELFRDAIILSDLDDKKIYLDFMCDYYFNKGHKPKRVYLSKIGLSEEEKQRVDEFNHYYTNYFDKKNDKYLDVVSVKKESLDVDKDLLISIVQDLMKCDIKYVLLDYYKRCNYSVQLFYQMAKPFLSLNETEFLNKFYSKYRFDNLLGENGIDNLKKSYNLTMALEVNDRGIATKSYKITDEDKEKALEMLKEDNIPVTTKTFTLMIYKYFDSIKESLDSSKLLIKK